MTRNATNTLQMHYFWEYVKQILNTYKYEAFPQINERFSSSSPLF